MADPAYPAYISVTSGSASFVGTYTFKLIAYNAPSAESRNTIAIGSGVTASGSNSIAIGSGTTTAYGSSTIAIGKDLGTVNVDGGLFLQHNTSSSPTSFAPAGFLDGTTELVQLDTTLGDILYASANNNVSKLGIGGPGEVLTVAGGVPSWAASSGVPSLENYDDVLKIVPTGAPTLAGSWGATGFVATGTQVWVSAVPSATGLLTSFEVVTQNTVSSPLCIVRIRDGDAATGYANTILHTQSFQMVLGATTTQTIVINRPFPVTSGNAYNFEFLSISNSNPSILFTTATTTNVNVRYGGTSYTNYTPRILVYVAAGPATIGWDTPTIIPPEQGGTGNNVYKKGDTIMAIEDGVLSSLAIGSNGYMMNVSSSGRPQWTNRIQFDNSALSLSIGVQSVIIGATLYPASGSGVHAVAIGSSATCGGQQSVAIGRSSSSAGDNSIAIGRTSSIGASATNSVAIGYGASVTSSSTNSMALGNGASVAASNTIRLGDASITSITGQVDFTFPSDARDKTNIEVVDVGIDFLKLLKPVKFNYDPRLSYDDCIPNGSNIDTTSRIGFIAQDIIAAQQSANVEYLNIAFESTNSGICNGNVVNIDQYMLHLSHLHPIYVNAFKELDQTIKTQSDIINNQSNTIVQLQSTIDSQNVTLTNVLSRLDALENA